MYPVATINYSLALSVVALQIATLALFALYFTQPDYLTRLDGFAGAKQFIGRWGLWLGLLLSVAATVLSLFYSEVLGYAPCGLCWLQRVFLFPQVLLFAVALWKKNDARVADYSIALSVAGGAVALYQHYLQMGGISLVGCPASSSLAIDCASRSFFEFGYLTFPLIGASVFASLIVLMLFVRRERERPLGTF